MWHYIIDIALLAIIICLWRLLHLRNKTADRWARENEDLREKNTKLLLALSNEKSRRLAMGETNNRLNQRIRKLSERYNPNIEQYSFKKK